MAAIEKLAVRTIPVAPAAWENELLAIWRKYETDPVASNAVYSTVREAIVAHVLPSGRRLSEPQLAALFKRSRTPVHEALLRLEWEHLVERSGGPQRGFVVGRISREEILEVYAVRAVLEGLAARMAAQACLPSELEHLTWLNRRLRNAARQRDHRRMVELNLEFHDAIARGSRNGLLLRFMRQIHDWVRRFKDTTLSYGHRGLEAAKEHDALLKAIAKRDPDAAERIARAHTGRARQVRVMMLQGSREYTAGQSQ